MLVNDYVASSRTATNDHVGEVDQQDSPSKCNVYQKNDKDLKIYLI